MTFEGVGLAPDIQKDFEGIAQAARPKRAPSKTAGAVGGRFDDGHGCSAGRESPSDPKPPLKPKGPAQMVADPPEYG